MTYNNTDYYHISTIRAVIVALSLMSFVLGVTVGVLL